MTLRPSCTKSEFYSGFRDVIESDWYPWRQLILPPELRWTSTKFPVWRSHICFRHVLQSHLSSSSDQEVISLPHIAPWALQVSVSETHCRKHINSVEVHEHCSSSQSPHWFKPSHSIAFSIHLPLPEKKEKFYLTKTCPNCTSALPCLCFVFFIDFSRFL